MQTEQIEIAGFLASYPPFDGLPEQALNYLATQVEIAYYQAGTNVLNFGEAIHDLYVIRSGVVETYRRTGELHNRLDEGNIFGQMGLLMHQRVRFPTKAIEDTLVYCIPFPIFTDYVDKYESFADYFEGEDQSPLRKVLTEQQENSALTSVKVNTLLFRDLITVQGDISIRDAAITMTDERVSSLLIVDERKDREDGYSSDLIGMITDTDLRKRVLAEGLSFDTPVSQVMTKDLITLDDNTYVFEAVLTMLRYNIHHIPIMHRHQPIGVIALSDVVRHESQSSILLVRSIFSQPSVAELAELAKHVPSAFVRMVKEDANSHMIGSAMSVIGRSFKQRLLEMAEAEFGKPPVPYCFLALGSMARDEQLIYTDQDNALVLDDAYNEEEHGEYFEKLSRFVSDGLAECGYIYCDGGIMATNPEWRKTLSEWKTHFSNWIDKPEPQALLNSSIFFDLDGVWGQTKWAKDLHRFVTSKTKGNQKFLACIARNALNRTPPLGFFKGFVMEKDGQHKDSINIKRRGTAPLSDVVRVHALAVGSRSINSFKRLDDIIEAKVLPPGKGRDLSDAFEYISMVRIRHQAWQIENGETPNNNIHPDQLSSFERRNLKEAFQVVSNEQNFLKYRYNANASLK
ncbi:DUF294 nucleotidyltransferase-like domain-containing protein [Methylophaga sp. OBS3]|uniref:DUF294 nucleotidyltransferase-like domain-containing protein n=1 Tax=Methylophaga sp. OBS3 TaxID=2991934 RepID=UPI00224EDE35|nr:DUF294 nucleotidyltransferase-like domain-containing protein [Methylophaga sp. OBS3]MCX4190402.1 DUF294 nucleotidyltransferase-like domain-containing protein [Methylophaga sp. OBS3]